MTRHPAWAPDGRSIVLSTFSPSALARIAVKSGEKSELVNCGSNACFYPRFSADGKILSYLLLEEQRNPVIGGSLMKVDLQTGARQTVARSQTTYALSPDGTQIAVLAATSETQGMKLEVMAVDSTGLTRGIPHLPSRTDRIVGVDSGRPVSRFRCGRT